MTRFKTEYTIISIHLNKALFGFYLDTAFCHQLAGWSTLSQCGRTSAAHGRTQEWLHKSRKSTAAAAALYWPVPFLQPASFLLPRSYPARRKQKRRSRLIWEESKASAQATDSNISFEACAYTRPYWCQLSYPLYSLYIVWRTLNYDPL
jgi:hypothetical protein